MVRKIYHVAFLVLSLCLLCSLVFNGPWCTAQLSWSDNFNDGNYDGWTVFEGSYNASSLSLNTTGTDTDNFIYHNSSAAFGFWSFDLFVNESEGSAVGPRWGLAIIRIGAPDDENPDGYVLSIISDETLAFQHIFLWRVDAGNVGPMVCENPTLSAINGWQAINITRSLAGEFEVFVNGTSRMQGTDLTYTTSDTFYLGLTKGSMFDNLVVSGIEIPIPSTPPIPGFPR